MEERNTTMGCTRQQDSETACCIIETSFAPIRQGSSVFCRTFQHCSCGCSNILESWVASCQKQEIISIREATKRKLVEELGVCPDLKSVFRIDFISEPTNWRGNPQEDTVDLLESIVQNAPKDFFQQYRRIIKWVFSTLMEAALKMHSVATGNCKAVIKSGDRNGTRKWTNQFPPQARKKKAKEQKLDLTSMKITDFFSIRGEHEP